VNELIEFLRAQLDEAERVAQAASPGPWRLNAEGDEVWAVDDELVADAHALSGAQIRATAQHIARQDPASVLADITAKREIIDLAVAWHEVARGVTTVNQPQAIATADALDRVVRHLATAYAACDGFRDEWRPA
jgi:hypothetical protein